MNLTIQALPPALTHTLLAIVGQFVVGAIFGALGAGVLTPWIGATAAAVWFVSREFAQSFRHSDPKKMDIEPRKFFLEAGIPTLVVYAIAGVLTLI